MVRMQLRTSFETISPLVRAFTIVNVVVAIFTGASVAFSYADLPNPAAAQWKHGEVVNTEPPLFFVGIGVALTLVVTASFAIAITVRRPRPIVARVLAAVASGVPLFVNSLLLLVLFGQFGIADAGRALPPSLDQICGVAGIAAVVGIVVACFFSPGATGTSPRQIVSK